MKNPRKSSGSAGGNLTYYLHGKKTRITTRWRLQTIIKEREMKVDNSSQKAVKCITKTNKPHRSEKY